MNSTIVRSERVAAGAARAGLETAPECGAQAGLVSGREAETTSGWLWHRSIRGLFPFARLHVARALRNRGVLATSAPVLPRPDVDSVTGLSPSISIAQKSAGTNPRSTVATLTIFSG